MLAGRADQRNDVLLDQVVNVDIGDGALCLYQFSGSDDLSQAVDGVGLTLRVEDCHFLRRLRIAQGRPQEKAVELRLG